MLPLPRRGEGRRLGELTLTEQIELEDRAELLDSLGTSSPGGHVEHHDQRGAHPCRTVDEMKADAPTIEDAAAGCEQCGRPAVWLWNPENRPGEWQILCDQCCGQRGAVTR